MFNNPSVLKTIDWENNPIYLRFGILNSVFSTLNSYFAGGKSICLLLRRTRFVYNFIMLTLISQAF